MNEQPSATAPKTGLIILNIVGFVVMIIANALAVYLPLNNKTTRQLADQYPNLFTPAGITFSIWPVIYLFLLGFIVYQARVLSQQAHPSKEKVERLSRIFFVSCLANAGWIFAWHYEQVTLSVAIMLLLLFALITIHHILNLSLSWKNIPEKLWLDIPFSLYLGWILIATIANFTAYFIASGWTGGRLSPTTWAVIMIAAGALIALLYVLLSNNIFIGLVAVWAFYGIIMKRGEDGGEGSGVVTHCALVCIVVLALSIVYRLLKSRRLPQPAVP